MSVAGTEGDGGTLRLIYTYGTLKKGFPNHPLLEDLIGTKDAVFMGSCETRERYPLVCGLYGVPYLIHLPGSGHHIKGELYGVTRRGLTQLDELEGVRMRHYERRPIRVAMEGSAEEAEAEAYFAHRSYGEGLWKKRGEAGMKEYGSENALDYVKSEQRTKDKSLVEELFEFVGSVPAGVGD
ncbi:putative gamma-glutamylcyclotransferase At3g02910 [Prosopis cineraria]|uniref:putative gamma-glutamylcyclotransferase At3g02910 n=1 Tax=Prosopis cineraria TaxID=364024 RepID=UPI0024106F05|nr:putative gamma-glutamylcyclotransferase At3g02910 [Prosopis cineraria]